MCFVIPNDAIISLSCQIDIFLRWFDTFANDCRSFQKSFFSSMLLLTCGAHALTMFSIYPFTSSFMAIGLSDTVFTCKTLSTSSFLTTILFHFFFHQLHCRKICSHLQCSSFLNFQFNSQ